MRSMSNPSIYLRTSTCPLCNSAVPLQSIPLRATFDCPSCGKGLKVGRPHELAIRLIAVALGLLLARTVGLEGVWLFCMGLMISPFLVILVWGASGFFKVPPLTPALPCITTLGLGAR